MKFYAYIFGYTILNSQRKMDLPTHIKL